MTNLTYRGWIPTVGQRLSFSIVGQSKHPTPAISSNVSDEHTRHIISYQHRPSLLDSAIPFFRHNLARLLFSLQSDFRFICVARSGNDCVDVHQPLEGTLYLVRDTQVWNAKVKHVVKSAQQSLDQYLMLDQDDDQANLDNYVQRNISSQLEAIKIHCLYDAKFSLERNGVVTIYPSTDQPVSEPRTELETLKNQILTDQKIQDIVCAQMFYFLKDICHVHQHHHPTTDAIVGLYPKQPQDSDLAWINRTLRILYSKVLEYKRVKDDEIYASALGVLAYVKAFKEISKGLLGPLENSKLALRNDDTLETSIHASQIDYQASVNRREGLKDSFKFLLLGIIGLLVAVASLGELLDGEIDVTFNGYFNMVEFIANLVINRPIETVIGAAMVAGFIVVRKDVISWKTFVLVKDIVRLVISTRLNKFGSFLIYVLLALGTFFATYQLIDSVPDVAEKIIEFVSPQEDEPVSDS